MGTIIPTRNFSMKNSMWLLKPVIYCNSDTSIEAQAISLNKALAQELIIYKPKRRTMQIEKCLFDIIDKLPENSIIKDFDVLFNPNYKIDVLKIMVNVCKAKPFSMIWPGTIDGNKLVYAEEGYIDYKTYDVNDYDVTCII